MIPRLHVLTDSVVLSHPDFLSRSERLLEAGGKRVALHLRAPDAPARALLEPARRLERTAGRTGASLLVNDRVDLALILPFLGAHLPEASLPVRVARRLLGRDRLLGGSVHSGERALRAEREGADFLVVGTIYASRSHPGVTGAGPARVRELAGATAIPLLAVGGVTPDRVGEVLHEGGYGVAVIRGVWQSADPTAALEDYLRQLEAT